MEKIPLVSVCAITYNHEYYITQFIQGVLIQQTEFPIELVIGEDASTDRTFEICKEFQLKYPDKIRILRNESNIGLFSNFMQTLISCRGKYIALCEGDDYWTDPYKLQKQVDLLEKNEEIIICSHNVNIVDASDTIIQKYPFDNVSGVITLKDYLAFPYNLFHFASVMFRADAIKNLAYWWKSLYMVDWPLFMCLLQQGKGYFMSDNMAVWRHHHGGIWSQQPALSTIRRTLDALQVIRGQFGSEYSIEFNKIEYYWLYREVLEYAADDNFAQAKNRFVELLRKRFIPDIPQFIVLSRFLLMGKFPKLHRIYRKGKTYLTNNKV